jgi:myo-inositol-1-phosphate synthase
MTHPRIGLWFIGARGGVATTATLGLLALEQGHVEPTGLVTALSPFASLDLVPWRNFVIGGHDVRCCRMADTALTLAQSRALPQVLLDKCWDAFNQIESNISLGVLFNSGPAIERLVDGEPDRGTARQLIHSIQKDLRAFARDEELARVVVVNVASTEPPGDAEQLPGRWADLDKLLDCDDCPLQASSLYAIAALDLGMAYINFTPSAGASLPAIQELATLRETCHAGRDGKTGETLLKSVLAPMFAARNLDVLSWVGHNIFGNMDGQILDHPANKSAKIVGKDQLLGQILGYDPQTLVTIEYIRSLGDWKTAWDHIHFRGFLGTPMTMQFTWQGCDSLLAAPLVLDLVRLVELSRRCGETGVLRHLGGFFKQPLGLDEASFWRQTELLEAWAKSHLS